MKLITLDQRSAQWHIWRAAGLGASDAAPVAAAAGLIEVPAWMPSLQELWERKVGMRSGPKMNFAMQRGVDNEDVARELYQMQTGNVMSPVCGEMDLYHFIKASLDGIRFDGSVILEIKVPSMKVHSLAKDGQVVDYYKPQLAQQALVAWGHPESWKPEFQLDFFTYVPEIDEGARVEVPAMEIATLAEQLLPKLVEFWHMVESNTPPCGNAWSDAAAQFIAADVAYEELKSIREDARQRCIDLATPTGKLAGFGVSANKSPRKGSVDYPAFLAAKNIDPSEAEAFRGESTESWTVSIAKPRKSKAATVGEAS